MQDRMSSPSVVVGVDGSRNAVTAALWAVDEAVQRDTPLRLLSVIDSNDHAVGSDSAARAVAAAENALRGALVAIESTGKPVKVETETLQGSPTNILLEVSRAAAMLCIGAVGRKHAAKGRLGSTAAALATRAHCPVAIIRGYDPSGTEPGAIVVEMDNSVDGEVVLQRGINEALLRNAPLTVIAVWRATFTDVHDGHAVAEQNRQLQAQLNRRLACSTRRHPRLDISPVAVHGSLLNYLTRQKNSIQLVVVDRRRAHGVAEMIGPTSYAALHDTQCSVLVCDPHHQL
jgi:nucleotide-binding universal stress UspA family protein